MHSIASNGRSGFLTRYRLRLVFQLLYIKVNKELVSYVNIFPSAILLKVTFAKLNQLHSNLECPLVTTNMFPYSSGSTEAWSAIKCIVWSFNLCQFTVSTCLTNWIISSVRQWLASLALFVFRSSTVLAYSRYSLNMG